MENVSEFLIHMGFAPEDVEEYLMPEHDQALLEACEGLYRDALGYMQEEFDDFFILRMFVQYNGVFMRSDFRYMLDAVREQLNTDLWATLLQYESGQTGESSVFELMDDLRVGNFEAQLRSVCAKVRALWVADYGEIQD